MKSHVLLEDGYDLAPQQAKHALKREFARRLQHAMLEKGWNQSDLARAAFGVDGGGLPKGRDKISNYLNANTMPEPVTLDKIVKALGVSREDVLPTVADIRPAATPQRSIEFIVNQSDPTRARLRIDREMSTHTAIDIMNVLKDEQ